ncbi:N6-Methyl-AMP deaminase-like [Haliotis cracherodii]|uniref:N6-Methyl-AMP deaminase-like n=1 Tax=Haliotis cracherodii TaxID=6455 RepID=UPI0039E9A09A
MSDGGLRTFCAALPKIELHAHLNTSFSKVTLQALVDRKIQLDPTFTSQKMTFDGNETAGIEESFSKFRQIHMVCNDAHAIYTLTHDIIREFAADNVKYLELRSTPKTIPETGLTPEVYVECMLRAVRDCEEGGVDTVVRILPSIDRRNGVDVAYKTVDLAYKYAQSSNGVVCGIDFSGDPLVGDAADYIPVFQYAHSKGLKLALHLAEIASFEETHKVLHGTTVGRIGHGTFLHQCPEDYKDITQCVLQQRIPIETCMTSNLKSQTVSDYSSHHLEYWHNRQHPVIICTDGKGVYQTTVTEEYVHAAQAFGLTRLKLWQLSLQSIDHIFADEATKQTLRRKWESIKPSLDLQDQ